MYVVYTIGTKTHSLEVEEKLTFGVLFLDVTTMQTGTIAKVTDRGYGFIKTDEGGEDIFFHASELAQGDFNSLQEGDKVTFEIGENDKGPFAQNVAPAA